MTKSSNSKGERKRVAIIGAGISGLAHADVLERCGFSVVVFERAPRLGGVWAAAYPDGASRAASCNARRSAAALASGVIGTPLRGLPSPLDAPTPRSTPALRTDSNTCKLERF